MKRKREDREMRLCPKCKRPTLVQATSVSGWLDASMFTCKDASCGYTGRFFITIDPKAIKDGTGGEDPAETGTGDAAE